MVADMKDILGLVRSGRLAEATDAIRSGLDGGAAVQSAEPSMRDITPGQSTLPGKKPSPGAYSARPTKQPAAMAHRIGEMNFRLHRPSSPVADAPFVVMLHGCTQGPDDFAAGTRMNAAADRIGAHVLWPEQDRAANANGCWNWFEPRHRGRSGEAAAIADLVRRISDEVAPGASGIHVAGLSAGGAMAAILGAAYPELFASVGIHSGLAVGAADDMVSAFAAMRSGAPASAPLPLPAIVFHGTADRTVVPANGLAAATSDRPAARPRRRTDRLGGRDVTVTRTDLTDGAAWREYWEVGGLGHAWSGGNAAGSHADPTGPDATAEMLRFFARVDRGATAN